MIRNALFLCVVCALVFVLYLPSYIKMQDLNEKNRVFAKRINDLEKDNVRLDEERRRLVEDPVYFEKVAREKMGLIKNDEVIYKMVKPGQTADGLVEKKDLVIIKQVDDTKVAAPKAEVKPKVVTKTTAKKTSTKKTVAKKTKASSSKKKAVTVKKSTAVKKTVTKKAPEASTKE